MSADSLTSLIHEEYKIRLMRVNNGNGTKGSINLMKNQPAASTSRSLEAHIANHKASSEPYCDHCKHAGHWTSKCCKFAGNKWKGKSKEKEKDKGNGDKSNMVVDNEEHIAFVVELEDKESYNFDTYNECNMAGNDKRLILYDWLADSATTSHVTHQCEAFTTYTPMGNAAVTGVGGDVKIAGQGTIKLISKCNKQDFVLILEDVLHVPSTQNNLLLLGRWDAAGGRYTSGGGVITLITKDGKHVGHGKKISSHLYKMGMTIHEATSKLPKNYAASPHAFISNQPALSWETWH
jgi:hypothetical protein